MAEGTKLSIADKKELAKLIYLSDPQITQKEVAKRVKLSEPTISKCVREGDWDTLRKSMLMTRENQLKMMYEQLDALNNAINKRKEKFPTSQEANTQRVLTASIKELEGEMSLTAIINVSKGLLAWYRPIDFDKSREIAGVFDLYIKHSIRSK